MVAANLWLTGFSGTDVMMAKVAVVNGFVMWERLGRVAEKRGLPCDDDEVDRSARCRPQWKVTR
jgi:hypothetical protein